MFYGDLVYKFKIIVINLILVINSKRQLDVKKVGFNMDIITQVNRMFRSRRVLAIGGKHCDYGWTGSVFIHFYVL